MNINDAYQIYDQVNSSAEFSYKEDSILEL